MLVIGQKLQPFRVAQEAGRFLVQIAQQREVVALDFLINNGLPVSVFPMLYLYFF